MENKNVKYVVTPVIKMFKEKKTIFNILIVLVCLTAFLRYYALENGIFLTTEELIIEADILSKEENFDKANKFYYRAIEQDPSLSKIKVKIVDNVLNDKGVKQAKKTIDRFILTDDSYILFNILIKTYDKISISNREDAYQELLPIVEGNEEKSIIVLKKLIDLNKDNESRIIELYYKLYGIYTLSDGEKATEVLIHLSYNFNVEDNIYKLLINSLSDDGKVEELRKLYLHNPNNQFIKKAYETEFPSIIDYIEKIEDTYFYLRFLNPDIDKIELFFNERPENGNKGYSTLVMEEGYFKFEFGPSSSEEPNNYIFDCYQGDKLLESYYLNNYLNLWGKHDLISQSLVLTNIENAEHIILRGIDLESVENRINPDLLQSLYIMPQADYRGSYRTVNIEATNKSIDALQLVKYKNLKILSTYNTKISNIHEISNYNNLEHLSFSDEDLVLESMGNLNNLKSFSFKGNFVDLNIFNDISTLKYINVTADDYSGSIDGYKDRVEQIALNLPIIDLEKMSGAKKITRLDLISNKIIGSLTNVSNLKVLNIKANKFEGRLENLGGLNKLYIQSENSVYFNSIEDLDGDNLLSLQIFNLAGKLDSLPIFDKIEHISLIVSPKLQGDIAHFYKYKNLSSLNLGGTNNLSGRFEFHDKYVFDLTKKVLRIGKNFEDINAQNTTWVKAHLILSENGYATYYVNSIDSSVSVDRKNNYAYLENNGKLQLYYINEVTNFPLPRLLRFPLINFDIIDESNIKLNTLDVCDVPKPTNGDIFKITD